MLSTRRPAVAVLTLSTLVVAREACAQTVIEQWNGTTAGGRLGFSVAGVGDVDGDGVDDVVVGADLGGANGGGEVFVFSGATGATIHHWFAQNGADRFGFAVLGPGDVDGDGVPDVVVGATAHGTLGNNTGRAYVYSGASGALLYTLDGRQGDCFFGTALATMSDLDGDGCADFAVGAHGDPAVAWRSGAVYVYSGKTGTPIPGLAFYGQHSQDEFGSSLSSADVDGDGHLDVIVGIHLYDSQNGVDSGRVEVYSGSTGQLLCAADGASPGDQLGCYGTSVAGTVDLDGDGFADFVAGAPYHNGVAGAATGMVTAFSGRTGLPIWSVEGLTASDFLGTSVAQIGATTSATIVGGAPQRDAASGPSAGPGLVYGLDLQGNVTFTITGQSSGDGFGNAVADGGDVDADGNGDLLVGAWLADSNGLVDDGAAYVYDLCSIAASWSNYGSGFPGFHGVPTITAEDDPVLGTTVTIDVSCSAKKPTYYYFFAGLSQADVPTNLGGDLLVGDVFLAFAGGMPTIGVSIDGDVPNDPTLCGLHVYCQALEFDPAAKHYVSFTDGLDLVLGD